MKRKLNASVPVSCRRRTRGRVDRLCCWLALAVIALSGCAPHIGQYKAVVKVTAADKPETYVVELALHNRTRYGTDSVLTAPKLIVPQGQSATTSIGDERGGVSFTATVTAEHGSTTAATETVVRRNGKTVWSADQTMSIPN